MFIAVYHILTTLGGREFVPRKIFEPIGMKSTAYSSHMAADSPSPKISQAFSGQSGRRLPLWLPPGGFNLADGAGAIVSNAEDMARIMMHACSSKV